MDVKPLSTSRSFGTGLVYDELLTKHFNTSDTRHPEAPSRILSAFQRCQVLGLVKRCIPIEVRSATEEELLLFHSLSLISLVKSSQNLSPDKLNHLASQYDSVYLNSSSYDIARLACGGFIDLVENIVKNKVKNGFALVRPPGHHATSDRMCGYCIFNNVALAAKYALKNLGIQRILIVDWDVHHGQGTQSAFYNDDRVLYFSIHRYEHGDFWPHLPESDYDYIGDGAGRGYNINVPLNTIGAGNAEYLAIFHQLLMPVAYEFSPELILVSAGFDSALDDFKGEMEVTPAGFAHILHMLSTLAEGRVGVILEGGYNLKSLSESVAFCLLTLLGDPIPPLGVLAEPDPAVVDSILSAITHLRPYWRSLCFQNVYNNNINKSEKLRHKPIKRFSGKHNSIEKPISYVKINKVIAKTSIPCFHHRTCLVYDEGMLLHSCPDGNHIECPARIESIYCKLKENNLLERCHLIHGRKATTEEIQLVHSAHFMESVRSAKPGAVSLENEIIPTYICKETYECALLAVGSTLSVVDEVLKYQARNGVALIRPPGHHADIDQATGFCYFNNIAVAAKYAQMKYNLNRILIVDWDVHHGNGTQHIFESNPSVLYISLHLYKQATYYPRSTNANFERVGTGLGAGFNVNIPWDSNGLTEADYIPAFLLIILPIAYQFNPELVLVSAGFDCAKGDAMGEMNISWPAFAHFTHLLCSLANGKVILVLEGGYNLDILPVVMSYCIETLLGDPCPMLSSLVPSDCAIKTISNVRNSLISYWSCLNFQADLLDVTSVKGHFTNELGTNNEGHGAFGDSSSSKPLTLELASNLREFLGSDFIPDDDNPHMFCVVPKSNCPHLNMVQPPPSVLNTQAACEKCGDLKENWVCLNCYQVYCGRFINEHMLFHSLESGHLITLSYADLSVWCYACESYINHSVLLPAKQLAHLNKFGENMPV